MGATVTTSGIALDVVTSSSSLLVKSHKSGNKVLIDIKK